MNMGERHAPQDCAQVLRCFVDVDCRNVVVVVDFDGDGDGDLNVAARALTL